MSAEREYVYRRRGSTQERFIPSMINTMTLEGFFSPTEMKNGLTTPSRVEELICMMQKQKDRAASNAGDATKEWLTVANTLASTENEECLNHLVQLNGLCFLNQWLQEAVKCSHDGAVGEELINALLRSLEKLPLCREKLNTSGILETVKKLFGHKHVNIKERAQAVFGRWADERVNDDNTCQEVEKDNSDVVSKTSSDEATIEDKCCVDKSFDSSPTQTAVEEEGYRVELGYNENIVARVPNNIQSDILDDGLKGSIEYKIMASSTFNEHEKCTLPSTPSSECNACQEKLPVDESYVCSVGMASSTVLVSQMAHEQYFHSAIKNVGKGLEDLSSNESLLRKEAGDNTMEFKNLDSETSLKACKEVDVLTFGDPYKTSNDMVKEELDKKSDLALESEDFEALEVAQKVSIAVEREVIYDKEQSNNSTPEVISRDIFSSESPDIVEKHKLNHHMIEEPNVVGSMTCKDVSSTSSSPKKINPKSSEVTTDTGKQKLSLESPKPTAILESCGKTVNGKYNLDLNTDVSSEDLDCELSLFPFNPVNLPAPVVVSMSKGAFKLPTIPLHFEGELSLRSSAATSSFHPASPANALDGEDIMSDSKQKEIFAEIDLNMAVDPVLLKEQLVPYGISSRDSSVEVILERTEMIQLGLNCVEEEEEVPTLLQLSSSTKPTMRNFDLNDDPCVCDSDPVFTISDSRMLVGRRDELSTEALTMGIASNPSSSNGFPGLDMISGMMEIENRSSEEGSLHLFMPETRTLFGELMNTELQLSTSMIPLKRKEPDSGWEPSDFGYNLLTL